MGYEEILVLTPLAGAFSRRAGVLIRSGQVLADERSEKEWMELMDADMKELLGRSFIESLDRRAENILREKMDEQKLSEYKAMGFNWREVKPIFQG